MKTIVAGAEIRAAPAVVWAAITGFAAYPAWTRAVRVAGETAVGADLTYAVTATTRGGAARIVRFAGIVERSEPSRELAWRGGVPLLLDLWFAIRLERVGAATRVEHTVWATGLGAAWVRPRLERLLTSTLQRFVDDLKRQAERAQDRARPGRRP